MDAPVVSDDEKLILASMVKAMCGDVSDMWLHRRLKEARQEREQRSREVPASDRAVALDHNTDPELFPEPAAVIANRRYWRVGEVRAWIAAQAKRRTHKPSRSKFMSDDAIAAGLKFLETRLSPDDLETARGLLEATRKPKDAHQSP